MKKITVKEICIAVLSQGLKLEVHWKRFVGGKGTPYPKLGPVEFCLSPIGREAIEEEAKKRGFAPSCELRGALDIWEYKFCEPFILPSVRQSGFNEDNYENIVSEFNAQGSRKRFISCHEDKHKACLLAFAKLIGFYDPKVMELEND